jgi:hypothetical protein
MKKTLMLYFGLGVNYLCCEIGSLIDEKVNLTLAGTQPSPQISSARGQLVVLTFELQKKS